MRVQMAGVLIRFSLTTSIMLIAPQLLRVIGDSYPPDLELCTLRSGEYECVVNNSDSVTIPCGSFQPKKGISFTYYLLENRSILKEELENYLQWNVSWRESGSHICCRPNVSVTVFEDPCYRLNITYAPLFVPVPWSVGTSKYPIISEPFRLTCPLKGNPPATYSWRKFKSLDMAEPLEVTADLTFTDDRQTWHVESYSQQDNGLYACYASNYFGMTEYHNPAVFFLSATACAQYQPGNGTMQITPSGNNHQYYKPGEDILLNCTFVFKHQFGSQLNWYTDLEQNGHTESCGFPGELNPNFPNCVQTILPYDSDSCKWTNTLMIENFSKAAAGKYICGHSTQFVEVTLDIEACYLFDEEDISVNIVPRNTTYAQESDIILSCLVANTTREGAPTWTTPTLFNGDCTNGTCDFSDYDVVSSYDETLCQWTSNLRIRHFSAIEAGVYSCTAGTQAQNITLEVAGIIDRDNLANSLQASVITISTSLTAIVIALPTMTVLFLWRRRRFIGRLKEPSSKGFIYDAFICAHDECRELVEEKILLHLEMDCHPPYKICWHLRNFVAGVSIMENITDAVYQSRKVVFVFSEHFMESSFCCMELEQAMHRLLKSRTRCIIPITLSEIAVPKEIKSKLTYLPLVTAQENNLMKQIKELIGDPMPENCSYSEGADVRIC